MIYESLIAPSENPTSLLEIKRALLTYDKVKIVDPNDRDVIPSSTYMSIIGMPLISMDMGAIRPMGKSLGYDDIFEKIVASCNPAFQQGLIEVVSTYNIEETKGQLTIGAVPTGGYPLNIQFVFWLYRNMAQDQGFLNAAILNSKQSLLGQIDISNDLSIKGMGDGGINSIPALPMIDYSGLTTDQQEFLTPIARARIASMIKYAGYCEMKNLVPVFPNDIYGNIVAKLLMNAHSVLSSVEEDTYWLKRSRILELCHEEFLENSILDSLSIEEVMKLRSKAWGVQAEARESLFESIGDIALDIDSEDKFEAQALKLIGEYRKNSESLVRERENLHFEIKCDIGKATLGTGVGLAGLLSQLQSPLVSMGLTLAAGGMWAFDKSKEYVPALREIKAKEEEMKRGAGFGLHNFYSRIKKG